MMIEAHNLLIVRKEQILVDPEGIEYSIQTSLPLVGFNLLISEEPFSRKGLLLVPILLRW